MVAAHLGVSKRSSGKRRIGTWLRTTRRSTAPASVRTRSPAAPAGYRPAARINDAPQLTLRRHTFSAASPRHLPIEHLREHLRPEVMLGAVNLGRRNSHGSGCRNSGCFKFAGKILRTVGLRRGETPSTGNSRRGRGCSIGAEWAIRCRARIGCWENRQSASTRAALRRGPVRSRSPRPACPTGELGRPVPQSTESSAIAGE